MVQASDGSGAGCCFWLMLRLPPVEAEAIVTYANNYLPYFIKPGGLGLLTVTGFIAVRHFARRTGLS